MAIVTKNKTNHERNHTIMKKGFSYILAYLTLGSVILTQAINGATIDVYANHEYKWNGFMNWFENNGGVKGNYVQGSGWGVSDLKTTITTTSFVPKM